MIIPSKFSESSTDTNMLELKIFVITSMSRAQSSCRK